MATGSSLKPFVARARQPVPVRVGAALPGLPTSSRAWQKSGEVAEVFVEVTGGRTLEAVGAIRRTA